MNGSLFGSIPLNTSTLIRLIAVIVLALVVRQLILRLGTKAIDNRRDKHNDRKPRR